MGPNELTGIPVKFYRTSAGGSPVLDWLRGLSPDDRFKIGEDLRSVQFGWPIGMPLCRPLGAGLWEVRSSLTSGRIARLLFCMHEGKIGVLHGFIKKTRNTPPNELELARRRMKEMQT